MVGSNQQKKPSGDNSEVWVENQENGNATKDKRRKNAVKDEIELRVGNPLLDFIASRSFMTWGE